MQRAGIGQEPTTSEGRRLRLQRGTSRHRDRAAAAAPPASRTMPLLTLRAPVLLNTALMYVQSTPALLVYVPALLKMPG